MMAWNAHPKAVLWLTEQAIGPRSIEQGQRCRELIVGTNGKPMENGLSSLLASIKGRGQSPCFAIEFFHFKIEDSFSGY